MTNQAHTTPGGLPEGTAAPMDASTRLSYERTALSRERTLLSHERTLMSWVRTAIALITFGFTLYKFFELEEGPPARPATGHVLSPRQFAVILIAIGLLALFIATVQNVQYRTALRRTGVKVPLSLSSLVAGLIAFLGLLAMAAAVFRW